TCLSMMNVNYPGRCLMARQLIHCDRYTNIFNYFELMYCVFEVRDHQTEVAVLLLFGLIYFLMFCIVYESINQYYLPALKIAASRFMMNEYLAGVILVGVANSTSDFLLNLSAVRSGAPTMNIVMCNALTSICLIGGAICFIMPFKINSSCVCRDFLFVIFLLELIRFFMESTVPTNLVKSIIIFLVYPIYLAVNIIDFFLTRHNIRSKYQPSSPQLDKKLYDKLLTVTDLEVDDDVQVKRTKTQDGIYRDGVFFTPKPLFEPKKVNVESNRTALHSKNNPKNRFLFTEFIQDINPIDPEQWVLSGKLGRIKMICMAPVLFFLRLTIPMVNYEHINHGWSKLLNCLQIIINPFIILVLLETAYYTTHGSSFVVLFYYHYALLSLVVTVPLSAFVFIHSRTDIPPPYHKVLVFITITTVITYVWICAWEMEVIVTIIGAVFNRSSNYMTVTFNAISNAVPDMIALVHLTKNGYGKMAFGGVIGGIVFSMFPEFPYLYIHSMECLIVCPPADLVSNLGAQFARDQADYQHMFANYGETLYLFLMLTVWSTMWWCFTLDFNARRSGGIFLWCLFGMFCLYVTLMEMELIHDFADDTVIYVER
ncbi:hypothetical protein KR038_005751, partial [Drosophila bunnanda]